MYIFAATLAQCTFYLYLLLQQKLGSYVRVIFAIASCGVTVSLNLHITSTWPHMIGFSCYYILQFANCLYLWLNLALIYCHLSCLAVSYSILLLIKLTAIRLHRNWLYLCPLLAFSPQISPTVSITCRLRRLKVISWQGIFFSKEVVAYNCNSDHN